MSGCPVLKELDLTEAYNPEHESRPLLSEGDYDIEAIRDCGENCRMAAENQALRAECNRLLSIMPPTAGASDPRFVGQGDWAVFAEKVVRERDRLRKGVIAALDRESTGGQNFATSSAYMTFLRAALAPEEEKA